MTFKDNKPAGAPNQNRDNNWKDRNGNNAPKSGFIAGIKKTFAPRDPKVKKPQYEAGQNSSLKSVLDQALKKGDITEEVPKEKVAEPAPISLSALKPIEKEVKQNNPADRSASGDKMDALKSLIAATQIVKEVEEVAPEKIVEEPKTEPEPVEIEEPIKEPEPVFTPIIEPEPVKYEESLTEEPKPEIKEEPQPEEHTSQETPTQPQNNQKVKEVPEEVLRQILGNE